MSTRLAIVGVGLIGGSLALAWKRSRRDLTLIGYDTPEVLRAAKERGMIDEAAPSVAAAVSHAQIVVLSVPMDTMRSVLKQIAPHLQPGTLVTDVGSVKIPVMAAARATLRTTNPFIGGHPMAGSERGGLSSADAFLFENATYVLCPEGSTPLSQNLIELIEAIGARILILDADRHDRIAACTSHVPQLLATILMNVAAAHSQEDSAFLQLAAGGFRDMTRIASSPFELWQPILHANKEQILITLHSFMQALQSVMEKMDKEDTAPLREAFRTARHIRGTIPKDSKGFLHPLADVFVYAKDQPGTLTHITATLFRHGINIKDIELLKIREGTGGAFRLSFPDDATAEAAVVVLEKAGCRAHRL